MERSKTAILKLLELSKHEGLTQMEEKAGKMTSDKEMKFKVSHTIIRVWPESKRKKQNIKKNSN